jgi:hypothetical protein
MSHGLNVSVSNLPRLKRNIGSIEEVDALGWAAGLSFTAYGVRVGIRVNDRRALDLLPERLPFGWKGSASPLVDRLYSLVVGGDEPDREVGRSNVLYSDATELIRTADTGEALEALESHLQLYVAEMACDRVFVHAGAVGWRGKAIVIPGRSNTGKTTLVAELVRAGAAYYSDEYAVLDMRGRVYPFARPLAIRSDDGSRSQKHSVERLGGRAGAGPLPVGLVIVSTYRTGARWRPRLISPGKGALELLDNSVPAQRRPEAVLAALHAVVSRARVLKGARGEAGDMVPRLLARLSD